MIILIWIIIINLFKKYTYIHILIILPLEIFEKLVISFEHSSLLNSISILNIFIELSYSINLEKIIIN